MIDYIQPIMLTFIEALCCKIFFDTFLEKKYVAQGWKNKFFFVILFLSFTVIVFLNIDNYLLKTLAIVFSICIIMYLQYKGKRMQIAFLSIAYYGLVLSIDRIMLIFMKQAIILQTEVVFNDPIKFTILLLLCKTVLFFCILFINRKYKAQENFNLITDSEWIRFLFFPFITIISMSAFAMTDETAGIAVLILSFGMVLSNFLVFYMIQDIVMREKDLREISLSQERVRNQMSMYRYMESIYGEQQKSVHEFKNQIGCLQGLLKSKDYLKAEEYIGSISNHWIEKTDYINTNHAVVNSVLNQKIKLAKLMGIPIILSVGDLQNVFIKDEDLVTILANLLDNAIEACEKLKDKEKIIKFRFVDEDDKIIISIRNPVDKPIKITGNRIITTKNNPNEHGIGMINIKSVVEQYKGETICSYHDGYFTQSIIINHALR